ncbi:MAG: hypothetical protein OEW67_05790 [Cyclobacteriaceae bacterium]|nr:hypothetical protein [Cyclobacteriaceae bacterium]
MKAILKIFIGIILFSCSGLNNLQAQNKATTRVYIEHFKNRETYQLSVRVITKEDKRYLPTAGIEVELYASEISSENLLETVLTTENGTATYTFNHEQFEYAENAEVAQYFAVVNENEKIKGKVAEITIKKVNFTIRLAVEDSIKKVYAYVSETDSIGNSIPKKGVEIKFLVDRPLSPLPVGEDYNVTNKEGRVSMEFPDDLPGDTEGHLKVMVRIIENEDYGTVEVSEVVQWGIPMIIEDKASKRSLWASSANAPISLLIFINSLIIAVWGIIVYIIYKIFQIRKLGREQV